MTEKNSHPAGRCLQLPSVSIPFSISIRWSVPVPVPKLSAPRVCCPKHRQSRPCLRQSWLEQPRAPSCFRRAGRKKNNKKQNVVQKGHKKDFITDLCSARRTKQHRRHIRIFHTPGNRKRCQRAVQFLRYWHQRFHDRNSFFHLGSQKLVPRLGKTAGQRHPTSATKKDRHQKGSNLPSGIPSLYFPVKIPDARGLQIVVPIPYGARYTD